METTYDCVREGFFFWRDWIPKCLMSTVRNKGSGNRYFS